MGNDFVIGTNLEKVIKVNDNSKKATAKTNEVLFNQKERKGITLADGVAEQFGAELEEIVSKLAEKELEKEYKASLKDIADKNGVVRKGLPRTADNPTPKELVSGIKKAEKVTKAQVNEFLRSIKHLGLNITQSTVYSSKGILSPDFILQNGTIVFAPGALERYTNQEPPMYFETASGQWAEVSKYDRNPNPKFHART